jgi:hypothetical protein
MSIFRMLRVTEQIQKPPAADGKLGFEPGENVKLDSVEDMITVRILIHVLQDEPDKARAILRVMSPRDRALLSFILESVTRLVSEEEDFRRMEDRRAAREARQARDTE